jgi:glycerophosphoryl diester phosphodiesterase
MTLWPYPFWIAHRGAGKLAPENTLAAFRLGASHGHRAFECDVKLSREGEPFLLHDAELDRTAGSRGIASERTWDALSRLDAGSWHSPAHAGEPIPRLEGIARFCLANGCALNIEIKPTPGQEAETGREVAHAAARLWANAAVPPLLSSFQVPALVAAQAAEPALPRALLLDTLDDGWQDHARQLACVAVVFRRTLLTAALIAEVQAEGRRVLAYTVNDPAEAQRLIDAGIDGLITDAVDQFKPGSLGRT